MNRVLKLCISYLILMFAIEISPYYLGYLGSFASEYLGQFIYIVIPVIILAIIFKVNFKKRFKLNGFKWSTLLVLPIIYFSLIPISGFISTLTTFSFGENPTGIVAYTESLQVSQLQLLYLLAITPAICEEIMFRGFLIDRQSPLNIHQMAFLNGLMFGLFHVGYDQVFYTFALGTVFAYAVIITNSIFVGMILHFLNNGFGVLVQIFVGKGVVLGHHRVLLTAEEPAASLGVLGLLGIVGTIIIIILMKVLKKSYEYDDKTRWANEGVDLALYQSQSKLLTYLPILLMIGYVLYRNLS